MVASNKIPGLHKMGRTEAEMREALKRFCNAAWSSKTPREGKTVFSIPPQPDDADIILMDAIDELLALRKLLPEYQTLFNRLKELVQVDAEEVVWADCHLGTIIFQHGWERERDSLLSDTDLFLFTLQEATSEPSH